MTWREQRAEIRRLMADRPDPDGRCGDESPEAEEANRRLDEAITAQPVWRRARVFYE